jgi:serine/threonine protein kinase
MVLDAYQTNMYDLLKTRKRLTEFEVRVHAIRLLGALKCLSRNYVVHGDIKLQNIFIGPDTALGDFGLAAILEPGQRLYAERGTLNYKAPEMLDAPIHGFDANVDIWSLGVAL